MENVFNGSLLAHFETGMEGVNWILMDNEKDAPNHVSEASVEIETGDHLKIKNKEGIVIFDSIIVRNKTSNHRCRNGGYTQQVAAGVYCHWLQHGFSPDEWAELFNQQHQASLSKNVYTIDEVLNFKKETPCTDTFITLAEKTLLTSMVIISQKQPRMFDICTDINKENFTTMDFYNAQLYANKSIGLLSKYPEDAYVWIYMNKDEDVSTMNVVKSFDGFITDSDFHELVVEIPYVHFPIENYLSDEINAAGLLSDSQVLDFIAGQAARRVDIANHYDSFQSKLKVFVFNYNGQKEYGAIIKIK